MGLCVLLARGGAKLLHHVVCCATPTPLIRCFQNFVEPRQSDDPDGVHHLSVVFWLSPETWQLYELMGFSQETLTYREALYFVCHCGERIVLTRNRELGHRLRSFVTTRCQVLICYPPELRFASSSRYVSASRSALFTSFKRCE